MPIPRQKRHPIVTTLVAFYTILILPVIIVYGITIIGLFLLLVMITLPWTLYFHSSNWGLGSKDRKLTREYAVTIETQSQNVNVLLRSIKRQGEFSSTVKFYPHKAKREFYCIPFVGSYSSTTYQFPMLSELFTRLEDSGWKRENIYDLFTSIATHGEMREELKSVKARACRGRILTMPGFMNIGINLLVGWAKAPPKMLGANGRLVVDVDVNGDAKWVLACGAIIRPKNKKTLEALGQLDKALGMWKFVETEDDLKEEGWWQYVVL